MRLTCRVVAEGGRTVAQSRDVAELIAQHGGRAREALRRAAPPAQWERTGITSWDFGELPSFIVRRVLGTELRSYPALIDRSKSVDLSLLETEQAAQMATRLGVRRLFALSAHRQLSVFAKQCPPPFSLRAAFSIPRVELEAFRESFMARVVEEAFGCVQGAPLPRDKASFDAQLSAGTARIAPAFKALERATLAAAAELQATLRALDGASKHPSATAASAEIRAQLAPALLARSDRNRAVCPARTVPALFARNSGALDACHQRSQERRRQARALRAAVECVLGSPERDQRSQLGCDIALGIRRTARGHFCTGAPTRRGGQRGQPESGALATPLTCGGRVRWATRTLAHGAAQGGHHVVQVYGLDDEAIRAER